MENAFKIRKGLIVTASGSTAVDIQGNSGQLFSITDSLTGVLMSVNDISGLPILEVSSDDTVKMGTFGAEGLIVSGSSLVFPNVPNAVGDLATITANGTISRRTVSQLLSDMGAQPALTNPVTGTGTTNYLPKFTGASTLGNSLIFDNGTNVGIGTTAPAGKLEIRNTGGLHLLISDSTVGTAASPNFFGVRFRGYGNAERAAIYATDEASNFNRGQLAFYTQDNGGSLTEKLRINSAGNVGIGTTNPGALLDVNGSLGSGKSIIRVTNSDTANYITVGAGIPGISNAGMNFTLDGTSKMVLSAGGNVGIGTISPTFKLDVSGTARFTSTVTAPTFSGALSGNAGTATILQTARLIGGVSFNGSANINLPGVNTTGNQNTTGAAATSTAASLFDLLPSARATYAWSVQLTAGTWADIFSANTVLSNGTWMVQAFVNDFAVGGQQYSETYSGVMSWGSANSTNNGGISRTSEVVLHRSGHAAQAGNFYLRTAERASSTLVFQGMSNLTYSAASTITFKFVKIF